MFSVTGVTKGKQTAKHYFIGRNNLFSSLANELARKYHLSKKKKARNILKLPFLQKMPKRKKKSKQCKKESPNNIVHSDRHLNCMKKALPVISFSGCFPLH